MEKRPLISVIVPIYNVENYIYKSVESVRSQTYTNLEIILVDDGSPDNCGKIADEFAAKDSRIKVIHKKNGGLSDARNAGLQIASGEYTYFFDSDDRMLPELLEKTYTAYAHTKADLVCFNYIMSDEKTGEGQKTRFVSGEYVRKKDNVNLEIEEYLEYKLGYCVWNKLYRSDIIRDHQLKFEDNSKIFAEDICFNLYYILYCQKIQMLPDCLYDYLKRKGSIMGQSEYRPQLNPFIRLSKVYKEHLDKTEPQHIILQYQELVFCLLIRLELRKVGYRERIEWVSKIEDKAYFYSKSDATIAHPGKWMKVFGIRKGMKEWGKAIEFYYGQKNTFVLWFVKKVIFFLKYR